SLGIIVGVLGGVVVAAVAGARRTESAYPRFVEAQHGMDAVIGYYGADSKSVIAKARRLPDVAESTELYLMPLSMKTESGRTAGYFSDVFPLASPDGAFGTRINRIKILEGRAANPDRIDEIVVSFTVAQKFDLHPGDRVRLVPATPFGGFVP